MRMTEFRLTTERLVLRKLSRDDADHVWSAAHTPGFTDGMTWDPPKDHAEIHAFTDKALQDWESGENLLWTIETKDGEFIGRINLRQDKVLPGNAWTFGYWVHPSQQRKGYATEAAKEVARFAFEQMGAGVLVTSHADWNDISGKVMQKIGMKHVGFTLDRVKKKGEPVRTSEYRLEKNDWESAS